MTRILIVDDEPLARRRLELLLAQLGVSADAVSVAEGVETAMASLAASPADILLLDIRMRDGTGFDLVRRLPEGAAPAIIFVTAFDDFAVRAFEIAAADYVVKPVGTERLGEALERAEHILKTRSPAQRRAALVRVAAAEPTMPEAPPDAFETEFWIRRSGGDFVRLEAAAIDFALVEEDYVRIFSGDRSYLLRESLRGLLGRLDPSQFIQVHRSALVRRSELAEVTRSPMGGGEVRLRSGRLLPLGRVHGKAVQRLLRGAPGRSAA